MSARKLSRVGYAAPEYSRDQKFAQRPGLGSVILGGKEKGSDFYILTILLLGMRSGPRAFNLNILPARSLLPIPHLLARDRRAVARGAQLVQVRASLMVRAAAMGFPEIVL